MREQCSRGRPMAKRGKEEAVASVPHRSFDETTASRADSQCKVMQTRWGPERLQERQGCLGKRIGGYHIIHLYVHPSLERTSYLESPLVPCQGTAIWDAPERLYTLSACFHIWHQWAVKITGKRLQRGCAFKVRQFVVCRQNKDFQTHMRMVSKGQGASLKVLFF